MSKTFMYKGTECVRQLICFSQKTTVHTIDKDAPIFGVNSGGFDEELRQLNSEIRGNIIGDLVRFWNTAPEVKFRFLLISFQKYIGTESNKFKSDEKFRSSVVNLFIALVQQMMIEVSPRVLKRESLVNIFRLSQIQGGKELVKAVKAFDQPYQKSLMAQDSMGYVSKNISETSSKEYKRVVEELVALITIKLT